MKGIYAYADFNNKDKRSGEIAFHVPVVRRWVRAMRARC